MSGGHFNYRQHDIREIADEVQRLIETNDTEEKDEHGWPLGHGFKEDTIAEFKKGLHHLRLAAIYAQRIDWLVSGDDGEDSFHRRLLEEKQKHLARSPKVAAV